MSSFSDDTSVLRKVTLDFLNDPKNSSLFPEDEDNTRPQQRKKTPKANKKRQGKGTFTRAIFVAATRCNFCRA